MIAITGCTGVVGSCVIEQLQLHKIPFRALARSPEKLSSLSDVVEFDYTIPNTYAAALEGVDQLLLIAPKADEHLKNFLNFSKDYLKQVVIISGISANYRKDSELALIEGCVYQAKLPFTTLRCNWFMQNFITFWRDDIVKKGWIAIPAGEGKTSLIDVRDIARCVVFAFADRKHLNKVYTLTGAEALSYEDVAHFISLARNKPVKYEALINDESGEMRLLFEEISTGMTAHVSNGVFQITGRAPNTFFEFAKENSKLWL
jgi:uncharacterized protein YbjT (DUF2867 family)